MINNMHCNYRLQYVHVFLTNASDVFSYSVFLAFCLVATLTKKFFFFFLEQAQVHNNSVTVVLIFYNVEV